MADLKKRTKEEKNLELAIMLVLSGIAGDDLFGGFLSASYFKERIEGSSIPKLAERVYLLSAGGMLNEIGIQGDAKLRGYLSDRSRSYTNDLAARMAKNHNQWYSDYREKASESYLTGDGVDYLEKPVPYSSHEISREAVTSVSTMNSDSQKMTSKYLKDFQNIETTFVWVPERDSRTCKVCKAMGGTYEEFWSKHFPDGPPAHPNCRCFLSSIRVYAS